MRKKIVIGCAGFAVLLVAVMVTLVTMSQPMDENILAQELIQAIARKDTDAVRQLLDRGISPGYQMPKSEGGGTALMVASVFGNADIVKLLLARGADAGVLDGLGRSAVFISVMQGDVDTLKALATDPKAVQTVNNPEMRNKFTALQVATDREDAPMTEILLGMGANPDVLNAFGESVRSMCLSRNDSACALVNKTR